MELKDMSYDISSSAETLKTIIMETVLKDAETF